MKQKNWRYVILVIDFSVSLQQGEEEEVKRPEVKAEDLIGARDDLVSGTEAKSKTFEVMQECGESSSRSAETATVQLEGCEWY